MDLATLLCLPCGDGLRPSETMNQNKPSLPQVVSVVCSRHGDMQVTNTPLLEIEVLALKSQNSGELC